MSKWFADSTDCGVNDLQARFENNCASNCTGSVSRICTGYGITGPTGYTSHTARRVILFLVRHSAYWLGSLLESRHQFRGSSLYIFFRALCFKIQNLATRSWMNQDSSHPFYQRENANTRTRLLLSRQSEVAFRLRLRHCARSDNHGQQTSKETH